MDMGLCMASLLDRGWEEALDLAVDCGISSIEPCAGGNVPKKHYDPIVLNNDPVALEAFRRSVEKRGMRIAALGAYGNPLHPDLQVADPARNDIIETCHLAAKLGVDRVSVMVGCPAGAPGDRTPNWIVPSIYPRQWDDAYLWQWEERTLPIWRELAGVASQCGVRLCVEPMAGDIVYNLETFLRLREGVGPTIAALIDPSHFWWQGIDVIEMILTLGDKIGFCHAKDVAFDDAAMRRNGLVPACRYDDWNARSWSMRAVGYGHDESFWRAYVTALRRAGYEGTVAIELQEPYMSTVDALRKSAAVLDAVIPKEAPPMGNWFESYSPGEEKTR